MAYKTVDIDIDLEDFSDQELIEAVEDLGYIVIEKESCVINESSKDEIYELYRDFITWDRNQMTDSRFVHSLKKFFEGHLGIIVS